MASQAVKTMGKPLNGGVVWSQDLHTLGRAANSPGFASQDPQEWVAFERGFLLIDYQTCFIAGAPYDDVIGMGVMHEGPQDLQLLTVMRLGDQEWPIRIQANKMAMRSLLVIAATAGVPLR